MDRRVNSEHLPCKLALKTLVQGAARHDPSASHNILSRNFLSFATKKALFGIAKRKIIARIYLVNL